ncbi:MAG: hypothetical protein N2449_04945 [Bacteroidales bacterium]|nr:hypothetical protein [Bacteroidales bacterium]
MKTLSIFAISVFAGTLLFAQQKGIEPGAYFAISLQPSTSDVITFAIVELNEKGEVVNRIFLKRTDWLRQIVGIQESIANVEGKNLMKEAGVENPDIVKELWKLRYSEFPYRSSDEKGWASNPRKPSDEQMKMLNRFGIFSLNDFVVGEKLFELFKAMEDPGWVSEYQSK